MNLKSGEKRTAAILVSVQFSALAILAWQAHKINSPAYRPFNNVMVGLGLLTIFIAYWSLRPSLKISPIPKAGAPFIATGIYRYLRHPMYLGVLLTAFGLAGRGDSALSWVVFTVLFLDLQIKSRLEDRLLAEIHPEAAHYQSHTSRLFPCLGTGCRGGSCSLDTPE